MAGKISQAEQRAQAWAKLFPNAFYIEVQRPSQSDCGFLRRRVREVMNQDRLVAGVVNDLIDRQLRCGFLRLGLLLPNDSLVIPYRVANDLGFRWVFQPWRRQDQTVTFDTKAAVQTLSVLEE